MDGAKPIDQPRPSNPFSYWPTSKIHLDFYEQKMLAKLKTPFRLFMVPIVMGDQKYEINTLETLQPEEQQKDLCPYPLVMIHGFGGGLGIFLKNYDELAKRYKIYSFDTLGTGKSSRPRFPTDAQAAEDVFIESIEAWRKSMNIDKFILLGHSFGGYQAAAYALRYHEHIEHLILADPWGVPTRPENFVPRRFPWWAKVLITALRPFAPFTMLRAVGPLGPYILPKVRPDIGAKFADAVEDPEILYQYIYHLNVQKPSGELGFQHLTLPYGFAKLPIIERIGALPAELPITFLYGQHSWMDTTMGRVTMERYPHLKVNVHFIKNSGHHVYCDDAERFNLLVSEIADTISAADTMSAADIAVPVSAAVESTV